MTIVLGGYMLRYPLAGNVLAFFSWVLGLHLLGHKVVYVESAGWPESSFDPSSGEWRDVPAAGYRTVGALFERYCPSVPIVFVDVAGATTGMSARQLQATFEDADLALDVGGVSWLPGYDAARCRALVDMDPLFGQVSGFSSGRLGHYDIHFSYGQAVGRDWCRVPASGIRWRPVMPPVVTSMWQDLPVAAPDAPYTTIANWNAYGSVELDGETYGQKDVEFQRLIDLPKSVGSHLQVALTAPEDVRTSFISHGWAVRDALRVTATMTDYRAFLASSRGEISPAKNAYVKSRSGWFSDRTACYLASGRPAIVQDTGISALLPSDRGLLTFDDLCGAVAGLTAVESAYSTHSVAATAFATRYLAHDVVLPPMLDDVRTSYRGSGSR